MALSFKKFRFLRLNIQKFWFNFKLNFLKFWNFSWINLFIIVRLTGNLRFFLDIFHKVFEVFFLVKFLVISHNLFKLPVEFTTCLFIWYFKFVIIIVIYVFFKSLLIIKFLFFNSFFILVSHVYVVLKYVLGWNNGDIFKFISRNLIWLWKIVL